MQSKRTLKSAAEAANLETPAPGENPQKPHLWSAGPHPGVEHGATRLCASGIVRREPTDISVTTASGGGAELGAGTTIGNVRLKRLLGQGGMGSVWVADKSTSPSSKRQPPTPPPTSGGTPKKETDRYGF